MSEVIPETTYPGYNAEAQEVMALAEAYYVAAVALLKKAPVNGQLSYAPARLCSIHSIELYLNAFLRKEGFAPDQIRARMHNLADATFVETLKLRKKTAKHLVAMTERREYLISRYAPELTSQHTELNRLTATLVEVMTKVTKHMTFS